MPKAYSEKERELIIKALKKAALECMLSYGVRKTTVDELVKRVQIPKGTFYLFYASKEILLFDAINDIHDSIQQSVISEISKCNNELNAQTLTEIIFKFIKDADETSLAKIFLSGDMELIMRKLPNEIVKEHFKQDALSFSALATMLPSAKDKPLHLYESALRAIFLSLLHKREIGDEYFYESLKLLIKGLVNQLME